MNGRSAPSVAVPESVSFRSDTHILTVGLEDYFQVGAFQNLIDHEHWYRFDTRVERSTQTLLELLDQFKAKATFFVLGWIAEQLPELVKTISDRGHEIASRGYYHRSPSQLSPTEFREDLIRTRELLESITGKSVIGHRTSEGWVRDEDQWILDTLAEDGYHYDSSIMPAWGAFRRQPHRRFVHRHDAPAGHLWEVPLSTWKVLGRRIPIAGGNYFRQLPHTLLKRGVKKWLKTATSPFVMYCHTWEFDPDQPRISAAGLFTRIRHYRNLKKMWWVIEDYLSKHRFSSVADVLNFPQQTITPPAPAAETVKNGAATIAINGHATPAKNLDPVTIVIPCFNEEKSLPYLSKTLDSVRATLCESYRPEFLFVDDCSTDDTWNVLQTVFGQRADCTLVKHDENKGVAGAIMTGIRAASADVVCSMDCDCTYDPHELKRMIPLLTDGVDLVTASPYHPEGRVRNVPGWRLFLSKGLSNIYRVILPGKLSTYTSCFRVYRRSAVAELELEEDGFLGVAEVLGKLLIGGSQVVEYPATLHVRIFGESKMKTTRTIAGHVKLARRLRKARRRAARKSPE